MKKMIIRGLVAGGWMLGAAGLVLGAGLAKADSTHPVYGHEGDMDVTAFIPEMYPDGIYLSAAQAMQVARKRRTTAVLTFPGNAR